MKTVNLKKEFIFKIIMHILFFLVIFKPHFFYIGLHSLIYYLNLLYIHLIELIITFIIY